MATTCPIDGTKIGLLGGWTLKDGEICNVCGKKVGFVKGDPKSETSAHAHSVAEVKELIDQGLPFDPNHVAEIRHQETTNSLNGLDPTKVVNEKKALQLAHERGLDELDPALRERALEVFRGMSDMEYSKLLSVLAMSPLDYYNASMTRAQVEQNWIMIKQQDETNKLLRELINQNSHQS